MLHSGHPQLRCSILDTRSSGAPRMHDDDFRSSTGAHVLTSRPSRTLRIQLLLHWRAPPRPWEAAAMGAGLGGSLLPRLIPLFCRQAEPFLTHQCVVVHANEEPARLLTSMWGARRVGVHAPSPCPSSASISAHSSAPTFLLSSWLPWSFLRAWYCLRS